jgi:hypothetical protein
MVVGLIIKEIYILLHSSLMKIYADDANKLH